MGRRLYPSTEDIAKIETMANVPAGTHAKLRKLEAEHDVPHGEILYDGNHDDESDLHSFELLGFGRFDGRCIGVTVEEYSGDAEGERADMLLVANGIQHNAEYCEGVHWS